MASEPGSPWPLVNARRGRRAGAREASRALGRRRGCRGRSRGDRLPFCYDSGVRKAQMDASRDRVWWRAARALAAVWFSGLLGVAACDAPAADRQAVVRLRLAHAAEGPRGARIAPERLDALTEAPFHDARRVPDEDTSVEVVPARLWFAVTEERGMFAGCPCPWSSTRAATSAAMTVGARGAGVPGRSRLTSARRPRDERGAEQARRPERERARAWDRGRRARARGDGARPRDP